ncbi:MAG: tRNA cyclic N6-threonylcarbamoyladenosine(37) synthase TcdA [Gammaproteobacteria bacterium]|nr:MAG: tRNA cyclic N6-threonylcarbamoyladenosine(37) synthase TcdA [Gammaproteobacteria bacterium]
MPSSDRTSSIPTTAVPGGGASLPDELPDGPVSSTTSIDPRHAATRRVYGAESFAIVQRLRIAVVGVGGVGSWAVEALVRSGVGHVTMIDHDDVDTSNINRQLLALDSTVGQSKVDTLAARALDINPACDIDAVDDFLAEKNLEPLLLRNFDVVIDAIDSIRFKAAMIAFCRRHKLPIITTGGAGGRIDPLAVSVADLSQTRHDALAARVRARLRADYGFSRNPKRRFGIECVHSSEQPVYPTASGGVSHARPGVPGARLDCDRGYGSLGFVTGTFGFVAASRAIRKGLQRRTGLRAAD